MLKWLGYGLLAGLVVLTIAIFALQSSEQWSVDEFKRTPDARFADLDDYPFAPHYTQVSGYRMHYVDEGPADGKLILLLHGQPSWSYLYRHMITPLAAAGYRVIAPDLVGFGKSDKPLTEAAHSYQMHVDLMTEFVVGLNIEQASLFAQDWGGLIGLRVVAREPDRFDRIMLANTGLPAAGGIGGWLGYPLFRAAVWAEGTPESLQGAPGEAPSFTRWVAWARTATDFDFSLLFQSATERELTATELAGYAAPFPDASYQAAVRIFPYLVASQLIKNQEVMDDFYANWEKPLLTAFADSDPVSSGGEQVWIDGVPGAAGQDHRPVIKAGHFLQEDQPEDLVARLIAFVGR